MGPGLETVDELPADRPANISTRDVGPAVMAIQDTPPRVEPASQPAQTSAVPLIQGDEAVVLRGSRKRSLEILRRQPEPLFTLLDAARTDRVLNLLRSSGERYESLYQGKLADDLADYAPYLVQLSANSSLLISLLNEGWGESWGVYLTCRQPFEELRKHFRHFLLVQTEDGQELYFRFYDPRVLRVFLPTCAADEITQFFGPIASYLVESDDAQALLRFCSNPTGLSEESIVLAD